jgi:hypothetical protein
MAGPKHSFLLTGILSAALFGFAFVASPKACEWGLSAYFWSGVAVILILFIAPFYLRRHESTGKRIGTALLAGGAGLAIWISGLFIADIQIMCRLF